MEIAQEEVLTCIGMCIYNRLKRIQQCVKEEENACQVLGAVAVYALCRSFDMAVENKRGINVELIYDEISRDEKIKEAKKEQKKLKKRKKKNEKRMAAEEENGHGCDPDQASDKCACSTDDNLDNGGDYDDEDGHSHDSQDEDDDLNDKIIMCDGMIIDVGPKQSCKKSGDGVGGGGGNNGHSNHQKIAQTNKHINNQENHSPNNHPNSCTDHSDAVSVTSCHSCNNETDGPCTQRSIDAGYESHHDGSCCNSNNNSSRTSSIASTPEGSEVACSDTCCNNNGQANKLNKRNAANHSHHLNGNTVSNNTALHDSNSLYMSLEQMLIVSIHLLILLIFHL